MLKRPVTSHGVDVLRANERLVGPAITDRTKVVMPVHYAGVACEMEAIYEAIAGMSILVIEDAAQGSAAARGGRALGGLGDLGAISFHVTKNVSCGEGRGAAGRRHTIRRASGDHPTKKGTDRQRFFRGLVDKYTWVDVGSSYALSDLAAAYLLLGPGSTSFEVGRRRRRDGRRVGRPR